MIESGIYQLLAADNVVSGMVQASGGQARIYGVMLPKNYVLPAMVYSSAAYVINESLSGPNRLETRRFQFDQYGKTFTESRVLSRAVRNVFCPPDANGDPTSLRALLADGSAIESTRIVMDMDKPFEEGDGGYIFCALLDIEISFVNAA